MFYNNSRALIEGFFNKILHQLHIFTTKTYLLTTNGKHKINFITNVIKLYIQTCIQFTLQKHWPFKTYTLCYINPHV